MFLVSIIICNIIFAVCIKIYTKLTCGICKCSKHLVGKTVVITGGNAGIGYETAKNLAERGARTILGCRNDVRGTEARDRIIAATGNKDVHFKSLDLASLASIRNFVDEINKSEKRLDVLINNAGVIDVDQPLTADGLPEQMQVNYHGPFLLTNLLLPLLKSSAPSRIINLTSRLYFRGRVDPENLSKLNSTDLSNNVVYSNSKLCNVLMTVELSRLLKGSGVTANCLHPGVVSTAMLQSSSARPLGFIPSPFKVVAKTPWEGAQTSIYLSVAPEVAELSGQYFADCRLVPMSSVVDMKTAEKLWKFTEEMVILK